MSMSEHASLFPERGAPEVQCETTNEELKAKGLSFKNLNSSPQVLTVIEKYRSGLRFS
jgi:hypothetical protein